MEANSKLCVTISTERKNQGMPIALKVTRKKDKRKNFRIINDLVSPNYERWDKEKHLFNEVNKNDVINNKLLNFILQTYKNIVEQFNPATSEELFKIHDDDDYKKSKKPYDIQSFGDFLSNMIYSMKSGNDNMLPSKNYQIYINLLHKLEDEGTIINKHISEIDNKDFIKFGDYILDLPVDKGRSNYINIMKIFKSVHRKIYDRDLNDHILKYNYRNYAPKNCVEKTSYFTMSYKQYNAFKDMDVRLVSNRSDLVEYNELYRDFCVFLYEMKMRPADLMKLRYKDIQIINNKRCIVYSVEKKKNTKPDIVKNELTEVAEKIIEKYNGISLMGYIMPFSMNNYQWNMKDPKSWNKWENRKNSSLQRINSFLKKCIPVLKLNLKENERFSIYSFRHTAFTIAINKFNINPLVLAKKGGTSVQMLDETYYGGDLY